MKTISVLCPTRGRPDRCAAFARSAVELAAFPERVEVLVRVSQDDPAIAEYGQLSVPRTHWWYPEGVTHYPEGIEFLRERAGGEVFFCGSDDSLFRTRGWDLAVDAAFEKYPDDLLVAYANNGQGRQKCEQFFTTRRWVQVVGWLMRREYEHFCCDQDVEAIATAVDRLVFLKGVTVEHLHKKYGKAPDDATYQRVRGTSGTNERDLATFDRLRSQRSQAVARLRAVLG